jgi:hypothetical protein
VNDNDKAAAEYLGAYREWEAQAERLRELWRKVPRSARAGLSWPPAPPEAYQTPTYVLDCEAEASA